MFPDNFCVKRYIRSLRKNLCVRKCQFFGKLYMRADFRFNGLKMSLEMVITLWGNVRKIFYLIKYQKLPINLFFSLLFIGKSQWLLILEKN